MNILLIFFLLIETILSFRTNDFCFLDKSIQKQVVCTKQQCGFDLCSSDEQSCKQINDWYHISQKFISLMNIKKEIRTFYEFLQGIKDCKPREYVSIKKQVCLFEEACATTLKLKQVLNTTMTMPKKCSCKGNLKFKCGKSYCTNNKYTCSKILRSQYDSSYLRAAINKC
jgi:hypothetical protein